MPDDRDAREERAGQNQAGQTTGNNAQVTGGTQSDAQGARGTESERDAPGISTDKKSDDTK